MSLPLERTWKQLTPNQTKVLLEAFQVKPYLKRQEVHQLAKSVNISCKRLMKWFLDRRYNTQNKGFLCEGEESSG